MIRKAKNIVFLFLIILFYQCAPTRFVEPLDKGELAVGFNFGGPLINFADLTIPIPFTSLYGGYGYSEDLTLYGGFHLTSAAYKTAQFDLGAAYRLTKQKSFIPGLGSNIALNTITALPSGTSRFFPEVDLHLLWHYTQHWQTYIGSSAWVDLYKSKRQSQTTYHPLVFNYYLGQVYTFSKKWSASLEYKLLDPRIPNNRSVVDYVHWSNTGAQGIYLSVQYKL